MSYFCKLNYIINWKLNGINWTPSCLYSSWWFSIFPEVPFGKFPVTHYSPPEGPMNCIDQLSALELETKSNIFSWPDLIFLLYQHSYTLHHTRLWENCVHYWGHKILWIDWETIEIKKPKLLFFSKSPDCFQYHIVQYLEAGF